jgi:serine-threonine kinase receptor-associated protein
MPPKQHLAVQILRRKSVFAVSGTPYYSNLHRSTRKIWDTYTGHAIHSFPHNHIVRSVALSPTTSHLLTGGQEKKVRIFDLSRPDAEPDFLCDSGVLSHDGTLKSVIWIGAHVGVTAGEDGKIKCV